jgi:protein required for attachment to host cells
VIRQSYSPQVRNVVQHEVDKDLVKMPVYEIEKYLTT